VEIIISRHKGTIEYLKHYYPQAQVIEHLESIKQVPHGALVFGNLPINVVEQLKKRVAKYVHIILNVPKELRGKDLPREELEDYIEFVEIVELKTVPFVVS